MKCGDILSAVAAKGIDDLWSAISETPPRPYTDASDAALLRARFSAAYERHVQRSRQQKRDSAVAPEWKGAVFQARRELRESALARRRKVRNRGSTL